jgi:hypothetical protein
MSQPDPKPPWYVRVGTDWWATIVAGAMTVLAVTNLLPKIPW